ncbi:hypothetical protein VOLCADRAFT_103312 [Volvox carteri f. nagariensis]|uniref:Fucosyltransferase n=1 Tax=Volvox carteri f. nagariensis TaxID=3068 RepID=D8TL76_VOLCA|nr:uncharacterized protein VOLCADRAFT_103312 [Volvox carteri f. nagariensis]EFJ51821.1 hypothetical protein VOLCADRAFT_103312 [Volvox carteri f. nagariensis]|eukprot:XP_002947231.1 hypothetical protein VOLCADRAFT_103312 [Volvox carteri f. nagariensis]
MKSISNIGLFIGVFLATLGFLNFREHAQRSRGVQIKHEGLTRALLGRTGAPGGASTQRQVTHDDLTAYPFKPVEDVNIGVQTGHFFGSDFEGLQPNCTIGNTRINCRYGAALDPEKADALWYHIPSMGAGSKLVKRPKQLLIGMSMESSEYYPALDNKDFMRNFDIESSYRTCSQVPVFYFDYNAQQVANLFRPPLPFEEKKTALVYVNSNCGAKSGRSEIMRAVIGLRNPIVPTHSWGHCDRNMPVKDNNFNKVELIHGYKFCVAMENSITKDYITEKLWQALEAGCVPVYLGPHNVREFLPDPEAIVDYNTLGSPEALMKELERLANDKSAYEAKLAWKFRKWEELSPSFLAMTERSHDYHVKL